MNAKDNRKIIICWIFGILFVIRLIGITNPPLDYSSWRQVDTDSIARNFVDNRFNIFFPQLNYDGPLPNYVQLEFQVTTFIIAILYKIFGYNTAAARMVPVAFFMGSCYYLYRLVKRKSGRNEAILSVLFYGILPINIVYSRNIMPESALMFFTIGALYYFVCWIDTDALLFYMLAALFTALAVGTKVPAALIGIPMIYLAIEKFRVKALKNVKLMVFPLISLSLPYIYFTWLGRVAEQSFVNGIGSTLILPNFMSSIFKKENLDYLGSQFATKIFTFPGVLFFTAGLIGKRRKEEYFYYAWLASAVIHVAFIGSVIHLDYYLMFVTPIGAIFMGFAALRLVALKQYRYFFYLAILIIALDNVLLLKEIYKVQEHYTELGNYVSSYTDKNDLIIIDRDSPELLYTSGRKGWRLYGSLLTVDNIEALIGEGASYFVSSRTDNDKKVLEYLAEHYNVIDLPGIFAIYDLAAASE